jgi:hypothetical protein
MLLVLACTPPEDHDDDPDGTGTFRDRDTAPEWVVGPDTDTAPEPPDSDPKDTSDDEDAEAAAYAAYYAPGTLHEVRFTLTQDAIDELNRQVRRGEATYVEGDVQVDGRAFTGVGVRVKGSSTLRDFDDKPSLKVKFNEFVPGQDFAGLERITLNNMVEDRTQTKEVMVYRLFAEAGMLASLANHATVYVNDEYYGLYTNLETPDDHWLEHRFDDASGQFWEANDNAEFSRRGIRFWELASGTPDDTSGLEAVSEAITNVGDDAYADLDAVLDMDQFLSFWAWRILVGDFDGYPNVLNDCYIYGDPTDAGRFAFVPWGVDESWSSPSAWSSVVGKVASTCMGDTACKARFLERASEQLAVYETMTATDWLAEERTLIEEAVAADPRRTWSVAQVTAAQDDLASDLASWPDRVRAAMGIE